MANMKDDNNLKLVQVFLPIEVRDMLKREKTKQRKSISLIVEELLRENYDIEEVEINEKI